MSDTEHLDVESIDELLKQQPSLKALFVKALGIFADPKAGQKSLSEKGAELRVEILNSAGTNINEITNDN